MPTARGKRHARSRADKSNIGVFSTINDSARSDNRGADRGHRQVEPGRRATRRGSPITTTPTLNTAAIEKRGLAPVKADIDQIEAIADKGALAEAIGRTLRADTDPLNATNFHTENLFGIFVTQAFNDPTRPCPT